MGIPIGFDCEKYVENFLKENPHHVPITLQHGLEWAKISGKEEFRIVENQVKGIGFAARRRNFIVTMDKNGNEGVLEKHRKQVTTKFPTYKKIAKVMLTPPEG